MMADGVSFKLTGIDTLLGRLDTLSDDMRNKGGRAALRKAGNVIVARAKANAARIDDPGTGRSIADNIAQRWDGRRFKRTGDLGFRVGVMYGAKLKNHPSLSKNSPTPHWRLIEFGTENMRAHPIMRPAGDSSINEVVATFVSEYGRALDRAIARAKKKAGGG